MNFRFGILSVLIIFLTGCAMMQPQDPIALTDTALDVKSGRVGVVMTPLPKVDTSFPGAGCLLCLAAASAANSSLTAHTQKLPYEDLPNLKDTMAGALRKRGLDVIVIPADLKLDELQNFSTEAPKVARKDFTPFKQKYGIGKLVVIQIDSLGIWRDYSAYVPTSDPKAVLHGSGYMINLSNNSYEWFLPVHITKAADGAWDEPPNFPGLTNAYFQALELSKDNFLKPFSKTSTAAASPSVR